MELERKKNRGRRNSHIYKYKYIYVCITGKIIALDQERVDTSGYHRKLQKLTELGFNDTSLIYPHLMTNNECSLEWHGTALVIEN